MDRTGTTKAKDNTVRAQDHNNTTGLLNDNDGKDTTVFRNDNDVNDVDAAPASDNTGTNTRDRNDARLTPFDQGSSEADREITQAIRQAVVDGDEMSVNAQNVKIITKNGVVTLRGPVETSAERAAIETLAQRTAGVNRVDNQLEITNP